MKKLGFLLITICLFFFTGCLSNGFDDYYTPWYEDGYFPKEAYLDMQEENPVIIKTSDLQGKYREVVSKWYWCIGYSGFNGSSYDSDEVYSAIKSLCVDKRAKVAIYSQEYTNTRSGAYSVPHTNYHSYTGANGMMHSYTTTTYSTQFYSVDRYDYSCYLFVKIPDDYKVLYSPGIQVADLTQKDREIYMQNTGVFINTVFENSPAFYANLVHGDIITKINGQIMRNKDDFLEFQKKSKAGDKWNITIIRNGNEKNIPLQYGI